MPEFAQGGTAPTARPFPVVVHGDEQVMPLTPENIQKLSEMVRQAVADGRVKPQRSWLARVEVRIPSGPWCPHFGAHDPGACVDQADLGGEG